MIISYKMSILNHFGKVKASYKKYESDLPEYKGYICNKNTHNWQNDCVSFENIYSNKTMTMKIKNYNQTLSKDKSFSENEKDLINEILGNSVNVLNGGNYTHKTLEDGSSLTIRSVDIYPIHGDVKSLFSFTNLVETFSKCYENVREKMYSELWKTIECCPFINIIDLLILKHSDTDKHIEHLEEIVKSLIDDNKLLQTKINSLESQLSLFKSKIPIAVAVSECAEKTVAEEILNE